MMAVKSNGGMTLQKLLIKFARVAQRHTARSDRREPCGRERRLAWKLWDIRAIGI
jgi:hypothetical protein